jgi:glutaminyl-tRNA synthetase
VSVAQAVPGEVRLFDHLFTGEDPDDAPEGRDFTANLNPSSQEILTGCMLEPALADVKPGERYQLLRQGYYCVDPDSKEGRRVFNRTVGLVDSWARIQAKERGEGGRRERRHPQAAAGKEETK